MEISVPYTSSHVLHLNDELQLADHVAFLAHNCEGFPAIASVCVEEQPDGQGLSLRLARNKLQDLRETKDLQKVLDVLENCAKQGKIPTES
jgi:hypothetical protein